MKLLPNRFGVPLKTCSRQRTTLLSCSHHRCLVLLHRDRVPSTKRRHCFMLGRRRAIRTFTRRRALGRRRCCRPLLRAFGSRHCRRRLRRSPLARRAPFPNLSSSSSYVRSFVRSSVRWSTLFVSLSRISRLPSSLLLSFHPDTSNEKVFKNISFSLNVGSCGVGSLRHVARTVSYRMTFDWSVIGFFRVCLLVLLTYWFFLTSFLPRPVDFLAFPFAVATRTAHAHRHFVLQWRCVPLHLNDSSIYAFCNCSFILPWRHRTNHFFFLFSVLIFLTKPNH